MIKPGDEPIPGYRVEALLGRGQFGEVWRARSPGNTAVALKFLELSGAHGWKEFRAIQRVKEIRHAHLMPIVAIWLLDDAGKVLDDGAMANIAASRAAVETLAADGSDTLIAQPLLEHYPTRLVVATLLADQSLCDRLKACKNEGLRGIPVDELLTFMSEAAKGLDFLNSPQHKIGESIGAVQHCDVKPDNIMLTGGSVVIADFGVAQTVALARLNATATSLGGTPAYMAPELFVNRPSKTSDQYSLAVTYYELRTGELPFREQTYAAVYQAHREGTLDFSGCNPAEQAVLRRATATNPEDRYSSCGEFVEALRESVRPALPAVAPRQRSSLAATGLAAALAALVAAGLGYGVYRWLRPQPEMPMGRIALRVEPADAAVTVDGQPLEPISAGEFVVLRPIGRKIVVRASRPPDRDDREIEIIAQSDDQRQEITLDFSAAYYHAEALRLAGGGAVNNEAVAALAEAIRREPETYARLPDPEVRAASSTPLDRLAIAPRGARLVSAARDGAIRNWSLDADGAARSSQILARVGGEVRELDAVDDWTAALADADGSITLSHADGRQMTLTVPVEFGEIAHMAFAGDHSLAAVSEVLELLIVPTRRAWTLHAWDLGAADVPASHQVVVHVEGAFEPTLAAAHRASWAAVAATDGQNWSVRRYDLAAPSDAQSLYDQVGDVKAMVVSPDDRLLALGGGSVSGVVDRYDFQATLIDVGARRSQTLRRAHQDAIAAIAFDPGGTVLATGDESGNSQAWEIPRDWDGTRQPAAEPAFLPVDEPGSMPEGAAELAALVCPRPGYAAVIVHDRVVLWDCTPGAPQAVELRTPGANATALAATPDGRWLVVGYADGSLRFWDLPRVILTIKACAKAGQPLRDPGESDRQARRYGPPSRPAGRSPWGTAEIASRRQRRPTAGHGG
jgi:WD40 repeat protein